MTRTVDGLPYFLSLTDTAGQEEYRGLWASQNLKSDAFLLVYDITNADTLETLDYFMEMIDIESEQRIEDGQRLREQEIAVRSRGDGQTDYGPGDDDDFVVVGMPPPVKIMAGNKSDLRDSRAVSARQGLEYARKNGCGFMETSAREMVNIEETFARKFEKLICGRRLADGPKLVIIRRVVEARRHHYQQQKEQYAMYNQQKQQQSYLYNGKLSPSSADLRKHPSSQSSPQAHSKTPALTASEKESDNRRHQNDEDAGPKRQSRWLSVGRAMIGGRRSSSRHDPEALPEIVGDDKTPDGERHGYSSGPVTAGGSGVGASGEATTGEINTDQRGRSRSRSRWRRACCRS